MNKNIFSAGPSFWVSVGLIAFGTLLLLDNLNLFYIGDVWEFWPLIFILIGLGKLFNKEQPDRGGGLIFILLGVVFLAITLDFLYFDDIWQFWPVALILIGFRLLTNRKRTGNAAFVVVAGDGVEEGETRWANFTGNRIDAGAIFGGKEVRLSTNHFEGGNVVAIFGGVDVILGDSRLAPGNNVLEVVAIFGGADIYVPADWHVVTKGLPIFGGFGDERKNVPPADLHPERVLEVRGVALFGGVDIFNVKMKHLPDEEGESS